MRIKERVGKILREIPENVQLLAATKTRSAEEVLEAVDAGIETIGENYLQEAEKKFPAIGKKVKWHMLGHLQRNKAERAVEIFDMVETVDNLKLAKTLNRYASEKGLVYPVLIEVNSGREERKSGVFPEDAARLAEGIGKLKNIEIRGLMTMGPFLEDAGKIRPYFRLTKELLEEIGSLGIPGVNMKYLSMGMSDTWRIAIEEGANIVRLGTVLFGPRT
jgi:PLP dependent protein